MSISKAEHDAVTKHVMTESNQQWLDRMALEEEEEHKKVVNNASTSAGMSFSDHLDQAEVMQLMTPIVFDDSRAYWIWSDELRCYIRSDETDVLNGVMGTTNDRTVFTRKDKAEIMESIRLTGRQKCNDTKDVPMDWIQFKDCVYDLSTGKTFDATSEYFYINPIPHNLGDTDDIPTIDKLVGEWVGEDYKQYAFEMMSYCLFNGYPIHRIFVLFGSGSNGKGEFMKVLHRLVGGINTVSTNLERLSGSRFESIRLYGKRVALIGETNFSVLSNTARLKELSGEDSIPGERKGGASTDFVNKAKIIIATNNMPQTTDKTRGNYLRWIILDFMNEFDKQVSVTQNLRETEYENLCRRCVNILPGLIERGGFDNEGTIDDRAKKYEDTSDPLSAFIREMCVDEWDAREPIFAMVDGYEKWCVDKHYRTIKSTEVRKNLSNRYETQKLDEWVVDGKRKQWTSVLGIRLRDSDYNDRVKDVKNVNAPPLSTPYIESNGNKFTELTELTEPTTDSEVCFDDGSKLLDHVKNCIYKISYVKSLSEFSAVEVLMEMPRDAKVDMALIAECLNDNLVELKIVAVGDGRWGFK